MIHIALHFIVPLVVALAVYRARWRAALLVLVATMVVDIDHLLADPIYDPERCSIGFHPLHSLPAIFVYGLVFALPLMFGRDRASGGLRPAARGVQWVGLGLLIHMALDGLDCL